MLNLIDEIADALITVTQMKILFNEELVEAKIRQKLTRLEGLVQEHLARRTEMPVVERMTISTRLTSDESV
jgi:hypothetical protein